MKLPPETSEGPPTHAPEVLPPSNPGGRVASGLPIGVLCRFLVGRSEAIRQIAEAPGALGAGALLVLSAGLARNYDKREFPGEPWRLLGPFGASILIATIL